MKTIAETLQALRALPDDAEVTLSVKMSDLRAALEDQDESPERLVTTTWLSERLGMSREWWAAAAHKIPDAVRDTETSPWRLPLRGARRYLDDYRATRTPSRSRRRGPRPEGRTP